MSVLDDIMLALLLEKPVTQCVSWGSLRGGCAVLDRASVSHFPGLRDYSAHVLSFWGIAGPRLPRYLVILYVLYSVEFV